MMILTDQHINTHQTDHGLLGEVHHNDQFDAIYWATASYWQQPLITKDDTIGSSSP
ncbi:hypothetical protein [Acaryochloris sp. IP29b_bin.148]|uniref:hypothetical protein n=1 Tax=Acaryochloris sp. IP29b_bin.148 TaxID=2969218 RepID=UPI002627A4B2|nr:hypothetical protein [Acaryochloris sp. IP29b_bin.148]